MAQVSDEYATDLAREVRHTYLDATAWIVFDDVTPTLTHLSANQWRHIILSNHVPELPRLIEQLGLTGHFDAIHTSARTGVEKPNPEAFRRAVALLPMGATVWMIGDNPIADVQAAEAVGIPGILVRYHSAAVLRRCTKLTEIVGIVDGASLGAAR